MGCRLSELANGPGQLGEDQTMMVAEKILFQYNGHALMNWVLNIGPQLDEVIFYHIYTMFYYPWYNGGTTKGRIFVRSGSCSGDEEKKKRLPETNEIVNCVGWDVDEEQGNFETPLFVR